MRYTFLVCCMQLKLLVLLRNCNDNIITFSNYLAFLVSFAGVPLRRIGVIYSRKLCTTGKLKFVASQKMVAQHGRTLYTSILELKTKYKKGYNAHFAVSVQLLVLALPQKKTHT